MTIDINKVKDSLLKKQAELQQRLSAIEADLQKGHSRDLPDQAQERENDDVLDALSVEAKDELRRVDIALSQIANNTYGQCRECGEPIAEARLEAVPDAEFCIDCANVKIAS